MLSLCKCIVNPIDLSSAIATQFKKKLHECIRDKSGKITICYKSGFWTSPGHSIHQCIQSVMHFHKSFFSLIVGLLASVAALPSNYSIDPEISPMIVGGNAVNIEDYPYQVHLLKNGVFFCGGSILTDRYILTAAHCTE